MGGYLHDQRQAHHGMYILKRNCLLWAVVYSHVDLALVSPDFLRKELQEILFGNQMSLLVRLSNFQVALQSGLAQDQEILFW